MDWMPTVMFAESLEGGLDTEVTAGDPWTESAFSRGPTFIPIERWGDVSSSATKGQPYEGKSYEKFREDRMNRPITKEEYLKQVGSRQGLIEKYDPGRFGMSQLELDGIIRRYDERRFREFIFEHSPDGTWRKAGGIGVMFAMNATDPTNYIPIFGYGSEVNALGRFVGLGKMVGASPGWGAVVVNAADAAAGAALADTYLINRLHSEGENTQWSELMWDVIMSAGAGGVLTAFSVGMAKAKDWSMRHGALAKQPDMLAYLDMQTNLEGMVTRESQLRTDIDRLDARKAALFEERKRLPDEPEGDRPKQINEELRAVEVDRQELAEKLRVAVEEREFLTTALSIKDLDMELKKKYPEWYEGEIEDTQARIKENLDKETVQEPDDIPEATPEEVNASMRDDVRAAEQKKQTKAANEDFDRLKQQEAKDAFAREVIEEIEQTDIRIDGGNDWLRDVLVDC
jgi:hypothetical protein